MRIAAALLACACIAAEVIAGACMAAEAPAGAPVAAAAPVHAALPSASRRGAPPEPAVAPAPRPPSIVNGRYTSDHPAVGALLRRARDGRWRLACSGTLVGCNTVLTAAHCVCPGDDVACRSGVGLYDPGDLVFFLPHAGPFGLRSLAVHPRFQFPVGDVAVLGLAQPVTGVRPLALADRKLPPGSPGVIVGFGRSDGASFDYGLKRAGEVVTEACAEGISDETSLCWRFAEPIGRPGEDSNTCNGDSGGPLLYWPAGAAEPRIAGVTSGGINPSCGPEDMSYDADVHRYRAFVARQARDAAGDACAPVPDGVGAAAVVSFLAGLSPAVPSAVHAIEVPEGAAELRVALNAGEQGGSFFRLLVKHEKAPGPRNRDCRAVPNGQFSFCSIANPLPGTWYVRVRRVRGEAPYQLTATILSPARSGAGGL
jgi:hypothetical protein